MLGKSRAPTPSKEIRTCNTKTKNKLWSTICRKTLKKSTRFLLFCIRTGCRLEGNVRQHRITRNRRQNGPGKSRKPEKKTQKLFYHWEKLICCILLLINSLPRTTSWLIGSKDKKIFSLGPFPSISELFVLILSHPQLCSSSATTSAWKLLLPYSFNYKTKKIKYSIHG